MTTVWALQVKFWSDRSQAWEEWRLSWQLGTRIRLLRALLWYKSVKKYLAACWFALYQTSPNTVLPAH